MLVMPRQTRTSARPSAPRVAGLPWYRNPYVLVLLAAALNITSDLMLSRGLHRRGDGEQGATLALAGAAVLASPWVWAGITTYLAGFAAWLSVLRSMPLYLAYSFMSLQQAVAPIGAWLWLGEAVTLRRWLGAALVTAGVLLIAAPAARAEEGLA